MVENLEHLDGQYALALQHEDYRVALHFAVRALRRKGNRNDPTWLMRARETHRRSFAQSRSWRNTTTPLSRRLAAIDAAHATT